jgi:anti-anti-sigma regulatory factor
MLRITKVKENGSLLTLKVEGAITGEWVTLLDQECRTAIKPETILLLDFSEVTYMDDHGMDMLRKLPDHSITIINAPAFIGELLQQGGLS